VTPTLTPTPFPAMREEVPPRAGAPCGDSSTAWETQEQIGVPKSRSC
jgi:hypothetical protein